MQIKFMLGGMQRALELLLQLVNCARIKYRALCGNEREI